MPKEIPRINLFLITKEDGNNVKNHYTWIKDFNKLLYDQTKHSRRKNFCERCLHGYSSKELLEKHKEDCEGVGGAAIRTEMVNEKNKDLYFKNFQNRMKAPYCIYADFESINKPIEVVHPSPEKSFTTKTQEHEGCSYGFIAVRSDGKIRGPFLYRGKDAAEMFLRGLQIVEMDIKEELIELQKKDKLKMTPEDERIFQESDTCWICEKRGFISRNEICNCVEPQFKQPKYEKETCTICGKFSPKYTKVRDHCHITGQFRGAAHSKCNLQLKIDPDKVKIPVFFHNLRGYDSHLIMQAISKLEGDIKCIPNNMEKYISFSLGKLVFKDSFQFLLSGLDALVKSSKPEDFRITAQFASGSGGEAGQEIQSLLLKKGVYPYNHIKSWESFEETELPPIECFYNDLAEEHIRQSDYEHAQKVWRTLQCRTLGDYHDVYLKTDVLLLADIFENFRKKFIDIYGLDPAHYYTSPGLSWDALFKTTGVTIELLTDYDMHLFIEKGLRGGISMVSMRYAKANNRHLEESYDPEKESSYIMYLDANNLYGWAMCQYLPIGEYDWVHIDGITLNQFTQDLMNISPTTEKGFILEVDLEYPEELHDEHNAYPLAPECMSAEKDWLSPYQLNLLGESPLHKIEKLVPNLRKKEKYVVHYRNLQLYLSLGMKLTKVHRILKFKQSPWMKPYIEMNTEYRKRATCDFEKNLYKLMNNAVYGKTMENLRKRVDVKLIRGHEEEKLRKFIAKPTFHESRIFDHDLAAVHMNKEKIVFNKPIQVGMTVLDLSKHLMYDFYYNKLKNQYGNRCQLLYTDTDSLLVEIKTEDVYEDMKEHMDWYDTSDYPREHELYSEENKKQLGFFKDECSGTPIEKYVGLRPKMYCIKTLDKEIKKAKGIKRYVVKKEMNIQLYEESLFEKKTMKHQMNTLRSEGHNIYEERINKSSLSPMDSKRWIDNDGITTLAFGHKDIS